MAKRLIKAGASSNILHVFIEDTSVTTGAGLTGVAYNAAGLTCYYKRDVASASQAVTLADITTLGTFVSGGWKQVDATNMPGVYEFHPPDAALAAGAKSVVFHVKGATNMRSTAFEVEISALDVQDGVRAGLTALPNANAASSGGLITSGSGSNQLNPDGSGNLGVTSTWKKNAARANFEFLMTDSTNHAPATGKSVSVTRSIDGGAFGSGTLSAVSEVANGIYKVDFAAGDLNGNIITLRATATGCDDFFVTIATQP